ncbi:MAG: TrbI/VirB10 family protein [Rickettsiales bacterium]|jgi:type IV secretion system protein VirB10|nr:TrbI/VirB10 family protein [Rickettsiales bacterium]
MSKNYSQDDAPYDNQQNFSANNGRPGGGYYDEQDEGGYGQDDGLEVQHGASAVATAQSKNIFIIVLLLGGMAFAMYNIFFSTPEQKKEGKDGKTEQAAPVTGPKEAEPEQMKSAVLPPEPAEDLVIALPPEIVLPEPPKLVEPAPPPPPTPTSSMPTTSELPPLPSPEAAQPIGPIILGQDEHKETSKEDPTKQRKAANSLLVSGGGDAGGLGLLGGSKGKGAGNAQELERILNVQRTEDLPITSADQAYATRVGDLSVTIAQGKILDAVLETAINTDLPGMLRAIVSRDIYSEEGRSVLIPKGSRLVGNYEASIERGQRRVYVIWGRVIRPDGIDIAIDSPGIDQLGRAGVSGIVDNKYLEIFGNAFLLSAITIATGIVGDALDPNEGKNTKETTSTGTTETSSNTSRSIDKATTNLTDVGKKIVDGFLGVQPTIYVHQGTRIKVFVNRDLVFPPSAADKVNYIR